MQRREVIGAWNLVDHCNIQKDDVKRCVDQLEFLAVVTSFDCESKEAMIMVRAINFLFQETNLD